MLGAILGDIVGSPYEFDHNNYKHKDFPLLSEKSHFTDDTVMTVAVARGLMAGQGDAQKTFAEVQHEMRRWGKVYPHAGYGGMFRRWLHAENPKPYGSFGNGSAMRVSAAGWLFDMLDKTLEMAKVTAEVTHNHPEGIKGAQATAAVIFLARTGHSKPEIKQYVEQTFGYDLNRTCDEIRPTYHHVETCQETVPEAIIAFLESVSFEDALRNAVSLGGDGAMITDGKQAFFAPRLNVEISSTVGAGDSMVAGFIAGWLERGDYGYAHKLGAAAGSATAFSDTLATEEEIHALLAQF